MFTIIQLNSLNKLIDSVVSHDSNLIKTSEDTLDDLYAMIAAEDKYLISGDRDYNRQFEQLKSSFAEKILELDKMADTEVKTSLLIDIKKLQSSYDLLIDKQKSLIIGGKMHRKIYQYYSAKREIIVRDLDGKLRNLMRVATQDRNTKLEQSKLWSKEITYVIAAVDILALILVILIMFVNARKINLPIKLLGAKAKEVAAGKFGKPLEISSPVEIKELANDFNSMWERLQQVDQMKIDYINHLSHELRTPLTVIKEASSLLHEGVLSKVPEKRDELLEIISAECERLISSVNRMLDFSRMEAGSMFFSFQEGDIRPLLEKKIIQLSPLIQGKKMTVVVKIPPDLPAVRMDPEKIEEVFENLLGNSLKYTPEGGEITITASADDKKHIVEISVCDNGIGIPAEELKKIFDKFKRIDNRQGAAMGTGLGLAIVKHIVNAHGGNIWVKSNAGAGSVFTFSLPSLS